MTQLFVEAGSAAVKHGPMAIVGPGFPVLVLSQRDELRESTAAAIDEFVRIGIEGGRCTTDDGTLAGPNLDMAGAVRNAQTLLGMSLEEVVRMGSAYPADALGLGDETGRIRVGNRADLLLTNDRLEVSATWIGGQQVYEG